MLEGWMDGQTTLESSGSDTQKMMKGVLNNFILRRHCEYSVDHLDRHLEYLLHPVIWHARLDPLAESILRVATEKHFVQQVP